MLFCYLLIYKFIKRFSSSMSCQGTTCWFWNFFPLKCFNELGVINLYDHNKLYDYAFITLCLERHPQVVCRLVSCSCKFVNKKLYWSIGGRRYMGFRRIWRLSLMRYRSTLSTTTCLRPHTARIAV